MHMESLTRKYLLWAAVAVLLFIIFSASRIVAAELFSMAATRTMQGWESARQSPSVAQIESVARRFEFARFLADSDPEHHESIARLNLLRATFPDVTPAERMPLLQVGIAEIRTAIELRPVSPYSWTILLLIKRELGEYDAEFRHALHRAATLGPWEPELLTTLADVGLSAWDKMPAAEQALIQQVFVRGLERQSNLMRDVALAHRHECATRTKNDKSKTGCQ